MAANRERVREHAGAARLAQGRQVHGTRVVVDGEGGEEADGQVTTRPASRRSCSSPTACPSRWPAPGAAGVVHAGWRGLAGGVLEAGVARPRAPGRWRRRSAPASARAATRSATRCAPCSARSGRTLDLKAIARARLRAAGVEEIHDCGLCTLCDAQRFFSHRRERGVTGRQAGLAWRS